MQNKNDDENKEENKDRDTPWKKILERFLKPFLEFLLPEVAADINWSISPEFLDKELLELQRDHEVGKRIADKLIKVLKKDGTETYILIHVEIQGAYEKAFEERMYRYYYRINDRYKLPIMSMAVLLGDEISWNPSEYVQSLWGCTLKLTYPVIKLINFKGQEARLQESTNPFARIIEAYLLERKTGPELRLRLENQLKLVRNLLNLGYTKDEVRDLYQFIDYTFNLPDELNREFKMNIQQYEKEVGMQPYMSAIERFGMKEGERKLLTLLLMKKFGSLPQNITNELEEASTQKIEKIFSMCLENNDIQLQDLFK